MESIVKHLIESDSILAQACHQVYSPVNSDSTIKDALFDYAVHQSPGLTHRVLIRSRVWGKKISPVVIYSNLLARFWIEPSSDKASFKHLYANYDGFAEKAYPQISPCSKCFGSGLSERINTKELSEHEFLRTTIASGMNSTPIIKAISKIQERYRQDDPYDWNILFQSEYLDGSQMLGFRSIHSIGFPLLPKIGSQTIQLGKEIYSKAVFACTDCGGNGYRYK